MVETCRNPTTPRIVILSEDTLFVAVDSALAASLDIRPNDFLAQSLESGGILLKKVERQPIHIASFCEQQPAPTPARLTSDKRAQHPSEPRIDLS